MAENYKYSCCEEDSDFDASVRCNRCGEWYHFSCVNVQDSVSETIWYCVKCIRAEPSILESFASAGKTRTRRGPPRACKEKNNRMGRSKVPPKELQVGQVQVAQVQVAPDGQVRQEKQSNANNGTTNKETGAIRKSLSPFPNSNVPVNVSRCDDKKSVCSTRSGESRSSKASVREKAKREIQRLQEESMQRMREEDIERKLLEHELKKVRLEKEFMERRHAQERLAEEETDPESGCEDGEQYNFQKKVEDWQKGSEAGPNEVNQRKQSTLKGESQQKAQPEPEIASGGNATPEISSVASHSVRETIENTSKPRAGPTQLQIAARQVFSKTLPKFSGRPEEWPMFISEYEQANISCGFSDSENLMRLREALTGKAFEAVRNLLLVPENVQSIIQKLRRRFGNPEILSTMLANRIQLLAGPSSEDLESVIEFGSAVEEFTQHLKVTNLTDHLRNPILMKRLIQKLPASYAMQWVEYKRKRIVVDLEVFGDFMEELVVKALEATYERCGDEDTARGKRREKNLVKGFVNVTDTDEHQCCTCSQQEPVIVPQSGTAGSRSFAPSRSCSVCGSTGHLGRNCDEFRAMNLQDRWNTVQRLGLCSLCLYNHNGKYCLAKRRCGINQCEQRHHPLLHWDTRTTAPQLIASCNGHRQSVIFRMIPVKIYSNDKQLEALALIDEGSSVSLILDELAKELGAIGDIEPLRMSWTNGMSTVENLSAKINLQISAFDDVRRFNLMDVRTVRKLDLPTQSLDSSSIRERFAHLRDIAIPSYKSTKAKLLIGINNIHLIAPLQSRVGELGEPVAIQCQLGWSLYGPRPDIVANVHFLGHHRSCSECNRIDREMNENLKEYFSIEAVGISPVPLETNEERRAREILDRTTKRVGDRYESGLLWKTDDILFPESYQMSLKRANSLERRMNKHPGVREAIVKQLQEYLEKGYAHKITDEELRNTPPEKTWYLPLNFVINPKKEGKIRLVWDAAAKVKGVCLNDFLLKGPDMVSCLPLVISGFRERQVAFGGDIREMFHQVRVRPEDRQAQRFLFRIDANKDPQIFVMDVVIFGASCSPCTSQFVKNINAREHAVRYPKAAKAIIEKHFVDDYFDSVDTESEAIQLAKEVEKVHAAGGFEIRNWMSNSPAVLKALCSVSEEPNRSVEVNKTGEVERVLGVSWNAVKDVFVFSTDMRADLHPYIMEGAWPTKRIALRCIMSMFDPQQFLAPLLIHGRIIMQFVWRSGIGWDQRLQEEQYNQWLRWTKLFPLIENIQVPRCYLGNLDSTAYTSVQLHVFADAGEDAYGSVAYFRFVANGMIHCAFVEAKAKVAPLQHMSIPRKELQAAALGARLAKSIRHNHPFSVAETVMWTDSKAVYSWVRSEHKKYKEFVAHRVGQILSVTNPEDWRWVSTKNNAADDLTKWGKGTEMSSESRWFKGPEFLYQPEDKWPEQDQIPVVIEEEVRAHILYHTTAFPESLGRVKHISRWTVLVRVVATMYRFAANCRLRSKKEAIEALPPIAIVAQKAPRIPGVVIPLRQEEYLKAENCLWREAQRDEYADEVAILLRNLSLPKEQQQHLERSSKLYNKSPFLDDSEVLRVGGRTELAEFASYDTKYPIILPKTHLITEKLVEYYHQQANHSSRETVVNELRQRFYIGRVRAVVEKVIRECQWCKVHKAKPVLPKMAPLPKQRMALGVDPFSYVGIDYFGPLEVSIGRRREKRWVALFTCMTTRAVHLEVAHSLSTESCKMAIRRFIKRRRSPIEIFSDNGTNFVGASRELAAEIRRINGDCADTFTSSKTKWTFNPPAAPHMGGVWERMVRSVKEALNTLVDGGKLTDEILNTALVEAEDLINSRPLTYVSNNVRDDPEALTPNHFLKGSAAECLPPRSASQQADALRSKYCRAQQLADKFWLRWQKEYFPSLNKRTKWFDDTRQISVGDLVFVQEENRHERGIVEEVNIGIDGRIRSVIVKVNGKRKLRPVSKLAVLEVENSNPSSNQ
ncbi:uncharacterized protein LOC129740589 [Uranotaenia lowii]|uniref:uncharacterized protein LOC129740589 n=1 Tax=Uranotaenia lowii TaxID=190385 RepID=UPI00247A611A|nr:uncharacterized protein LOC129740589 [Uranotaenia lowii]